MLQALGSSSQFTSRKEKHQDMKTLPISTSNIRQLVLHLTKKTFQCWSWTFQALETDSDVFGLSHHWLPRFSSWSPVHITVIPSNPTKDPLLVPQVFKSQLRRPKSKISQPNLLAMTPYPLTECSFRYW